MGVYKSIFGCLLFAVIFAFSFESADAAAFIVEEGKPNAEIIIAEKPTRMQQLAASELQYFIQKITGAQIAITSKKSETDDVKIYIGKSKYTDEMKLSDKGLKYNAYKIISGDKYLVLFGNDDEKVFKGPGGNPYKRNRKDALKATEEWDKLVGHSRWVCPEGTRFKGYSKDLKVRYSDHRGSLMAVYGFLRSLGARWYFPGEIGEILPETKSIALPENIKKEVHPEVDARCITGAAYKFGKVGKTQALWMMRLGLGGGTIRGVHGINKIIHRDDTRKNHPERYVLYRGKRDTVSGGGKPCLSSKGLLEDHIKYVRTVFDVYGWESISVQPTDGFVQCECEDCRKQYTLDLGARGVQSNLVWNYVNNVAKEVYKTHPDRKIINLSYGSYTVAPTNIDHFSPNVYVMMNNHHMNVDPEIRKIVLNRRKSFLDKVSNKRPFTTNDNYTTAGNSPVPCFRPRTIAKDIRSYDGTLYGEYIEENALRPQDLREGKQPPVKLAFNHLNIYVTARLWWDSSQDVDAMLNEYYKLYYGPAEKEMKAFLEYCETNAGTMIRSKEQLEKVFELFKLAKEKVAENSIYGQRIALLEQSLEKTKNKLRQLSIDRTGVPEFKPVRIDNNDNKMTIDGKIEEPFWTRHRRYRLLKDSVVKNKKPAIKTIAYPVMSQTNLYIALSCEQGPGEKTEESNKKKDDPAIWEGEYVDILIETEAFSYYRISISPNGEIIDVKINDGKQDFRWDSLAVHAVHKEEGKWTMEIKIPFIADNEDPNHKLNGKYPGDAMPWFINVGRKRIVEGKPVFCSYSYTGKESFEVIERFARCYMGKSMAERARRSKAKAEDKKTEPKK